MTSTGRDVPQHEQSHIMVRDNETGLDVALLTNAKNPNKGNEFLAAENVKGDLFFYDINSLYPFVMKHYAMPVGNPIIKTTSSLNIDNIFGFIEVIISTPDNDMLKILPIRLKHNFSNLGIIYPRGTFKGVFFSEELKLAIAHGYKIEKIFKYYSFEASIIFEKFVDRMFQTKQDVENPKLKTLFKLMMNSLYGRYAGVYTNEIEIPFTNKKIEKVLYKNIAISSAIASYARCYMFSFLKENICNLLYVDTDGIILNKMLKNEYIHPTNLGKFKLVAELETYIALATKFYAYTTKEIKETKYIFRGITVKNYITSFFQINVVNILITILLKHVPGNTSKNLMNKAKNNIPYKSAFFFLYNICRINALYEK